MKLWFHWKHCLEHTSFIYLSTIWFGLKFSRIFLKIYIFSFNSFGHSCYGGFGRKRSDPSLNLIDPSQAEDLIQNSQPIMKVFPFPSQPPTPIRMEQQQKSTDQREKEIKFVVLSTINQVVEETLKKISNDYEK